jgi:hypothetical protein
MRIFEIDTDADELQRRPGRAMRAAPATRVATQRQDLDGLLPSGVGGARSGSGPGRGGLLPRVAAVLVRRGRRARESGGGMQVIYLAVRADTQEFWHWRRSETGQDTAVGIGLTVWNQWWSFCIRRITMAAVTLTERGGSVAPVRIACCCRILACPNSQLNSASRWTRKLCSIKTLQFFYYIAPQLDNFRPEDLPHLDIAPVAEAEATEAAQRHARALGN